jgi:glucan phosphoethanolaminetransferase (alkaline phosphatase superfamily)
MVRELVYALLATILFILSFLFTLSIITNTSMATIINYKLSELREISMLNIIIAATIALIISLIFVYYTIPKIQIKEVEKLAETTTESFKRISNQIIVLEEIDRNLSRRINLNEENNKKLEERIVALERLVLELAEIKKKS